MTAPLPQATRTSSFDPTALITAVALLVLGALAGVLWAFITPYGEVTLTADGSLDFTAADTAKTFGAVAVFVFLAFGLGAICGVTVWIALRETRGPAGLGYAALLATVSGGIAMAVAQGIGEQRFPGIDVHHPGTYRIVGKLWMPDATFGGLAVPWLLVVCATGFAVLGYFVCAAASTDRAISRLTELPDEDRYGGGRSVANSSVTTSASSANV
ncbi:DUF2567 domain-containing protein [Gordonia sp. PP30]|uniref:DUF2567 domain-containing protein n=1 Tax=Gordonia sp. PP30 TaxID=2935861 RepID=UPI001FFECF7E|nr:DUF2567 domain-containing protein [Gordonia sp. PP30]UQE73540.1 DUF2567 domain-containing protein [Gordonia sp. PP30]